MGDIVNLNKARKARDKAAARRAADANRLTFGRTKTERLSTQKDRDRDAARLDGHKLDEPEAYAHMAKGVSPYGDGRAAARIVDILGRDLAG